MATEAVLNFLQEQNRPYSANDVLQNIGKDHGKAAVQKALDKLVGQKKIIEKMYGKQKIYCIAQEGVVNCTEMEDNLRKMDQQVNELTKNLKTAEEELHLKTLELKSLENKMTTEEAENERLKLKEEIKILLAELADLKENSRPISDEEKMKINAEHEKCMKEFKKRKRLLLDITNAILEGYPKTKKHLFEDVGIETDEDAGFTLEQ